MVNSPAVVTGSCQMLATRWDLLVPDLRYCCYAHPQDPSRERLGAEIQPESLGTSAVHVEAVTIESQAATPPESRSTIARLYHRLMNPITLSWEDWRAVIAVLREKELHYKRE